MTEQSLESSICEILAGDMQKNALDFAQYLRTTGMRFECVKGYWEDKRYWIMKFYDEEVCYVLVNGVGSVRHKDEPEG
jgi:hypothetical protein